MAQVLIVDDDLRLRQSFEKLLVSRGHAVISAASGEEGVERVRERRFDLAVVDVRMPGMDGLAAFKAMQEIDPRLPVIVMTAYGAPETAIEAAGLGAFDYIAKPFDVPETLALIDKALALSSGADDDALEDASAAVGPAGLVGASPAMREVYFAVGRVAPTDAVVLVRGESGAGKELVARAVHHYSKRAQGPYVVVNCTAVPETLWESELFGYEKGAFTGAGKRKPGRVEQALGGTLFLDEIGDMPLPVQAKMLRLLEDKSIERLGGGARIPVDVRVVAATNRDLEKAAAQGLFREDLYYRLKVVTITLPPLRERREDVPLLADHFMSRFSREMGMKNPGLTDAAKKLLSAYSWPGNVRELANAIRRRLIFARGVLDAADFAGLGQCEAPVKTESADFESALKAFIAGRLEHEARPDRFEAIMQVFEAELIAQALDLAKGNKSSAARLLGLSRPTLLAKIDKHGLAGR